MEDDQELYLKFTLNDGGLGDRFVMTSNILFTALYLEISPIIIFYTKGRKHAERITDWRFAPLLQFTNFYEAIDFFHFKRPSIEIKTQMIQMNIPNLKAINSNMKHPIYAKVNHLLFNYGKYWPIHLPPFKKRKKIITFMFYTHNHDEIGRYNLRLNNPHLRNTPKEYAKQKFIDSEEYEEFMKIIQLFSQFEFVCLEDRNYAKNVELLSRSYLLIASEGMWTHLSRAMGIYTIAYSTLKEFIYEFTVQGHFCSGSFEECLIKLKEKCINLKI